MATKLKRKTAPVTIQRDGTITGNTTLTVRHARFIGFYTDPAALAAEYEYDPGLTGTFYSMPNYNRAAGRNYDEPFDLNITLAAPIGHLLPGEDPADTLRALHTLSRMNRLAEHNFFAVTMPITVGNDGLDPDRV